MSRHFTMHRGKSHIPVQSIKGFDSSSVSIMTFLDMYRREKMTRIATIRLATLLILLVVVFFYTTEVFSKYFEHRARGPKDFLVRDEEIKDDEDLSGFPSVTVCPVFKRPPASVFDYGFLPQQFLIRLRHFIDSSKGFETSD